MCERRTLATGVLALVVGLSPMLSQLAQGQAAQGQGAGAPQAPGGTAPQAPGGAAPPTPGAGGRAGGAPQGRTGGGGGGFGAAAGPFTPTPGAKDLKTVLFNWTWHMGMLRSGAESELVKTLDYHAAGGTVQVNGQPCTLTKYRIQANYQVPGWRTQIECTFKNKQTYKNVETLSGEFAWDEDMPGAELVAGKGKATPRPETLVERRIRLWASPHGAVKAAIAGAAGLPPSESFGENPAVLLDQQAKAGVKSTTTLEWQGEKAVLTFPIPDVPGAVATATLVNYLPESVVVTHGADKTEFIYGKWADWNNPLFKIDALYAGTMVERKNGTVLRSVTAKVTEIGQIYVIMPVPASVRKAAGK
jgi:hypothetical protein